MISPAWVMVAIASGGILANAVIAWTQASRVEGLESRLRLMESHVAVLRALCPLHGKEAGHDGDKS